MARPQKEINWDLVEKRMEAGISAAVIADLHFINIDTFYDRFKARYGSSFSDYSANLHSCGKSNILFTQYVKALGGNTHMLTLLGREWLGQGETKVDTPPNDDFLSIKHENMLLKAEIAEMKERANADQSKAG